MAIMRLTASRHPTELSCDGVDETCSETYIEGMNLPFKPPIIEEVLAEACVSISKLKSNPAAVIAEAQSRQVAILNRNKPVAYVVAPHVWEYLCDLVTEQRVLREAEEELSSEGPGGIEVNLDDYL
jgi:antitoxin StbD